MGIRQLGGDYLFLPKQETQLARGDSIKDTAVMLGRYGLSAVVLRAFSEADVAEFAHWERHPRDQRHLARSAPFAGARRPVHDLGDEGRLDNLKLAYK